MTQHLEEGAGLSQDGRRLPVPRESKLELLLLIQAPLASESPGPPRPAALLRSLRKLAGSGVCERGGRKVFWAPPSRLFPLSSRLFTTDRSPGYRRNPGVRAERPRHGFQEAPPPRPRRVSHGRAGGRNRATAAYGLPAHGTSPGRPLGPRKRCTRDSPYTPRSDEG